MTATSKFSNDIYKSFFNTVSSKHKRKLLQIIFDHGEIGYMDLLRAFGYKGNNESGKFCYFIRYLKHAGLVKHNEERKIYSITSLGMDVLDFVHRLEERANGISNLDITGLLGKTPNEVRQYVEFLRKLIIFWDVEFPLHNTTQKKKEGKKIVERLS